MKLIQWILGRKNRLFGGFFIYGDCIRRLPIKTIAYVDGFNLYFGSLRGTAHRWLDLSALVKRLCHEQNPDCELLSIKYYTADIKAKLSSHGEASCKAQQDYLLSLQAYSKSNGIPLKVVKGKYNIQPKEYYAHQEPVDFNQKQAVWVAEEKQTDVAIAVDLLCDAFDNHCDQVVIFSNDSDLAPALSVVKFRWPDMKIGVVAPIRGEGRQPSADLKAIADWTRHGIKEQELETAQLPNKVITRKRAILKPEHW